MCFRKWRKSTKSYFDVLMIGKKFSKDSLAIECNTRNVIEFGIFLVEKKNFNIEKKRKYFGQV